MHCFSFDIETVPDVEFGRQLLALDGVDEACRMKTLRRR